MANLPASAHAIIELDGARRFDNWTQPNAIARVTIDLTTDQASESTIEFFDPDFELLDSLCTEQGLQKTVVRVFLSYGADMGKPLFKGMVARIERGSSKTTIRCYDMGQEMRRVQRTEYHHKLDALGIIRKLATRNGLKFSPPPESLTFDKARAVTQDEQTDWDHARETARDNGLVLFVREDTLFARLPARVGQSKLALAYRKPANFRLLHDFSLSFKVPENVLGRPRQLTVRTRGRAGRRAEGSSSKGERGTEQVWIKRDLATPNKASAIRRAEARRELEREHAFECQVRTLPPFDATLLDARDTVTLAHVGLLFSGDYLCDRVTHTFGGGQIETLLELRRDIRAG